MEVTKPSYLPNVLFGALRADAPLVARLTKKGALSGRVIDPAGNPIRHALVLIQRAIPGQPLLEPLISPEGVLAAVRTDGEGGFLTMSLAPGAYTVGVLSPRNVVTGSWDKQRAPDAAARRVVIAGDGRGWENVDFVVPTVGKGGIRGRVKGGPVEATASVTLAPVDLPAAAWDRVAAGAAGRFEIAGVPAGSYWLFASAPAAGSGPSVLAPEETLYFARLQVEVTVGKVTDVEIHLAPARSTFFQLTRADRTGGAPCAETGELVLTSLEDFGVPLQRSAVVSAHKATRLVGLAPSPYVARVQGLGAGCYAVGGRLVDLSAGDEQTVNLELTPAATLRGRFLSVAAAEGQHGAVLLWPDQSGLPDPPLITLVPDAEGLFSAESLPPGSYRLLPVTLEDWANPQWRPDPSAAQIIKLPGGVVDLDVPVPGHRPDARRASRHWIRGHAPGSTSPVPLKPSPARSPRASRFPRGE
jgi:hypothetical protein